jgi:hypothetical protein
MSATPRPGWLARLLGHGEAVEPDPEEIVEAGLVGLVGTQIVMAKLADLGIRAYSVEERQNPDLPAMHARISCRVADLPRVRQVIEDVTNLNQ